MKKSERAALCRAMEVPPPMKKRAFLRTMPASRPSLFSVILSQAGYIRKTTWVLSGALFALALAAALYVPADGLWAASAMTPFAALLAVTELSRSRLYGMEELELSSRLGLKAVALARMGLIGLVHLALLLMLAAALPETARAGVYLLTPYLLTDSVGLWAARHVRGRDALYVCGGAAVLTAGLGVAANNLRAYAPENFRWWLPALALALALAAAEYHTTIQKTEELSWN